MHWQMRVNDREQSCNKKLSYLIRSFLLIIKTKGGKAEIREKEKRNLTSGILEE